jgi:peptide/nickel transport system permease protein
MSAPTATTLRHNLWHRLGRAPDWVVVVAASVPVLIVVLGYLLPVVTGYAPDEFVAQPLLPPSPAHPFGTDTFGRDVMVRTFAASHTDYLIAVLGVGAAALLGSVIGVFVASSRIKGVDWVAMRLTDGVIAFPFTVLALSFVVVLGSNSSVLGLPQGMPALLAAYVFVGWAYYARIARAQTVSLRSRDFVAAGRQMGFSDARIAVRHILPIVLATTMAYAVGDAIITVALTASLSFLGAGIAPPTPEWGQMMYEGRGLIETAWWLTAFPSLMLVLSGLSVAVIADRSIRRMEDRS